MQKVEHLINYKKKEGTNSQVIDPLEEEQLVEQIQRSPRLKHYRRFDSDDERNKERELFSAIHDNHLEKVRVLLKDGVKTNIIDKNNKDNTPLHYAIERGCKEIAEELLLGEGETDIDAQNNKGDTPLHISVSKSSRELVRLLLDKQARDDIKSNEGKVPHELAENQEIIDIFKNRGFYSSDYDDVMSQADLNEELMNTIRSSASEEEKLKKIESLLQKGAYVNFQDANRGHNTPLHAAVRKRELEVIKLLVEKKAIQINNNNGETPLDIAKLLNEQDIILQLNKVTTLKRENTGENKPEVSSSKKSRISSVRKTEGNVLDKYPASGLKNTLHGNIYQLKLLMLFLKRGLDNGYSFRLATEWDSAEKFDDLVFIYNNQSRKKSYRFLQAKHKLDESNQKITIGDLLTESKDGEFNLKKYFVSYLRIKGKKEFQDCNLEDFIICTNVSFDLSGLAQDRVKKLKKTSLGKNKGKEVSIEVINARDSILDVGTGVKYKIKYSDNLASHLRQGSKVQKEIHEQSINDIDKEIKEFFERLVFAVDQPNEVELGKILEVEIGKGFSRKFDYIGQLSKDAYNRFEKGMLDWLKEKEGQFFSSGKARDLFMEMEQQVSTLSIIERGVENANQGIDRIEKKLVDGGITLSKIHSHVVVKQNNKQAEYVWFNIESPSQSFTGREKELNELHAALQHSQDRMGVISQMSTISGLGGIGKTELIRQYVYKHSQDYDNNIIWINAENWPTLTNSFRGLASELNINVMDVDGKEKAIQSIIEEVYRFFLLERAFLSSIMLSNIE